LNKILIGVAQFEVLPEETLQYFYVWNLLDGTYLQGESFSIESLESELDNEL